MHPKKILTCTAACIAVASYVLTPGLAAARGLPGNSPTALQNNGILFLENNGQVIDQYNHQRKDVDFVVAAGGMNVFIGNGQIHYQWTKAETDVAGSIRSGLENAGKEKKNVKQKFSFYRLDAILQGANVNAAPVKTEQADYYENYYLPHCPDGVRAHAFEKITYKDVYPNIDWVIYTSSNQLKYDFVVHKGGNPADIKIRFEGATSMQLSDGELSVTTPFGNIREQKPFSYNAATKEELASSFALNGNLLSFNVAPSEGDIIIDPTINWGSYYGIQGSGSNTIGGAVAADASGNSYLVGHTNIGGTFMADFGSHQYNFYAGSGTDGYIGKFAPNGSRTWATYYGGDAGEEISAATCDQAGNLYIAGLTSSSNVMSSSGSYQSSNGGNGLGGTSPNDCFVAKFNSSGTRIWGSYYGGNQTDYATSVAVDKDGNVIIAGATTSSNGTTIASSGAHNTSLTPTFVAKLNATGTSRLWGTYYGAGGFGLCRIDAVACDTVGNVYIGGYTDHTTGIATSGTQHSSYQGGLRDGFVAKFSPLGSRVWGSYYGGSGDDFITGLSCDRYNNLFIAGTTGSAGIATTGTHQTSLGGGLYDGFLSKFNVNTGLRVWTTYLGGSGDEKTSGLYAGHDRVIYVAGNTNSSGGIATAGNHQTTYAGTNVTGGEGDGFLAKFDFDGKREWGTYFGGTAEESSTKFAYGGGKLFLAGTTQSDNNIATANGYVNFLNGTPPPPPPSPFPVAAFCAQFEADTAVYLDEIFTDTLTCLKDTLYIKYGVTNNFRAGNTFTLQLSDAFGSFANPTDINTINAAGGGTIKYWIADTLTPTSGYRVRVISSNLPDTTWDNGRDIRVSEYPAPIAIAQFPICANGTLVLVDNGTGPGSTDYLWTGPGSFSIAQRNYNRPNVQITDSGWYYLKADNYGCVTTDSVHVLIYSKPNKPNVQSNSPVCISDTLRVWATSSTPGITSWNWLKPSGFVQYTTGDTVIPSAAFTDTGMYIALAVAGGCPSDPDTTYVTAQPKTAPTLQIAVTPGNSVGPWVDLEFIVSGTSNMGPSPTYQWTKGGLDIPGAVTDKYNATTQVNLQTGDTICLKMTSSLICPIPNTAISCIGINIDLGVHDVNPAGSFGVYPNPNKGRFTLAGVSKSGKKLSLHVTSVLGQTVYKNELMPDNRKVNSDINLTGLADGVYLMQIMSEDGLSTVKFTIGN